MANIRQRGDKWEVRVRKHGVSRSKSFGSKGAANEWARNLEAELDRGAAGHRKDVKSATMGDLIRKYRAEVKPLKPWGRSKEAVLNALERDLGDIAVKAFTSHKVVEYAKRRHAEGASPQTIAPEISYLGSVLRVARSVWRYDISSEIIPDAQEALKLLNLTGRSKQRDRRPTQSELDRITSNIRQSNRMPSEYADIVEFAALTAMRLGEICNLRWDDYDAENRTILIRDRKHPTEKWGNNQTIPLLFGSHEIIERQLKKTDKVFPFNHRTVGTSFQRVVARLEIDDLHFHDLRHEGCSRMFEAGYQIQEVALVSGHRDWQQLKRYTQLKAADLHRLAT